MEFKTQDKRSAVRPAPKLAHLILAHSRPEMLGRLIQRLQHPDSHIYIHLDTKADAKDFEHLRTIPNVWFVSNRVKTEWGNFSLVQATLNGFEHIINTGIGYTHINLLSGQDYLLKPIESLLEFCFANTDKTFMHYLSISENEWPDGNERLLKYSFGDYSFPGNYRLQNLANRLLPNRRIPGGLKPYGRSQWLTMNLACAKYSINYIKSHKPLKHFFRLTWAADEVFFQTILCNSPLAVSLVNNNLRFIEQQGADRPAIFTSADVPRLMLSGKYFARKFDNNVDHNVFDLIDSAIGLQGSK